MARKTYTIMQNKNAELAFYYNSVNKSSNQIMHASLDQKTLTDLRFL
jgi:hypothetical protein